MTETLSDLAYIATGIAKFILFVWLFFLLAAAAFLPPIVLLWWIASLFNA